MGCCKKRKVDKLKSILEGWRNIIWSSELVKTVAHDRAKVCAECEKNRREWCTDCGCWIPAKARSLSEDCEKWKDI